ncbi:MAG: sulfite exporter TauE/SafE family protein [Alphaproteobacteria bacterium]|jgi:uncharacterized membrane protein YfcA|nr:sulfite exporter TauE/SafE family protein [Alphaproteobacteria bacterium]
MTLDVHFLPIAGAFVGFLVGLTGVGGGALMTPLLLMVFGLDLATAIATDLLFASLTKIASGYSHFKGQHVDTKVLKRLWMGSLPACSVVVLLVSGGLISKGGSYLVPIVGTLVCFSGISLLFAKKIQDHRVTERLSQPGSLQKGRRMLTILCGGVLGGIVALTSIGAGTLGAVMLRGLYPLRMTPLRLVATDTVHAIPIAFFVGLVYAGLGHTDVKVLGLLLLGSLPCAYLGSAFAARLTSEKLKYIIGLLLIGLGGKMVYNFLY